MSTPSGWYPDAQGTMRWFDGTQWTEHTQAPVPPAVPPVPAAPAAPSYPPPVEPPATSPYGTGAQPGWTPMPPAPPTSPMGPTGGGYPSGPPPAKSNTGLLVGLGLLGLVLVAGIVTTVVLLATRGGGDHTNTASDSTSPNATTSAPSAVAPTLTTAPLPSAPPVAPSSAPPVASGDSPEGVTQAFFDAIFKGDCSKVKNYVSGAGALGAGSGCGSATIPQGLGNELQVQVGKATVTGDTATVQVKLVPTIAGVDGSQYASSLTATLTDADGSWKITNVG